MLKNTKNTLIHRVKIEKYSERLLAPSVSESLAYMTRNYEDINIVIIKQLPKSLVITITCDDNMYNNIKFNFIKDMGHDFLWKD